MILLRSQLSSHVGTGQRSVSKIPCVGERFVVRMGSRKKWRFEWRKETDLIDGILELCKPTKKKYVRIQIHQKRKHGDQMQYAQDKQTKISSRLVSLALCGGVGH